MRKKCNTCSGTYSTETNGTRYFHVCPKVWCNSEKRSKPRANARNENIVQLKTADEITLLLRDKKPLTNISGIKCEGSGTTDLVNGGR